MPLSTEVDDVMTATNAFGRIDAEQDWSSTTTSAEVSA
jgi:hypothetical protein